MEFVNHGYQWFSTSDYKYKMALDDYERLSSMLARIQGKFLLTINDHETMREVFSGYEIDEVEVGYSIGKDVKSRRRYGELMVRNY